MIVRTIISLISTIFYIYELLIFARCILSFIPVYTRFGKWVFMATQPIIVPCRKLMDKLGINLPLDFSPLVAVLLMRFVQEIFIRIIYLFL